VELRLDYKPDDVPGRPEPQPNDGTVYGVKTLEVKGR